MARMPCSYIPPGIGNQNFISPQAAPIQFPGNEQVMQSTGNFQPHNNSGFMPQRPFVPNMPPVSSMKQSDNSVPMSPAVNIPFASESSPSNMSPFMQPPRWPPYFNCPPPFAGNQARSGYPYQGGPAEQPGPSSFYNTAFPLPISAMPPMSMINPQPWSPIQEDCHRNSVNEFVGEVKDVDADQLWVKSWLQCCTRGAHVQTPSEKNAEKLKVWQVKKSLQDSWELLSELEGLESELTTNAKEFGDIEWNKRMKEVNYKKALLQKHLNAMDEDELKNIKVVLLKRSKKRSRERKKRILMKENSGIHAENRKKLHLELDMWLERQQAEVELLKREESMKQEADAVLWGVRRKQSEGRKILSLLSALVKLHVVRSKKKECSTNPVPSEDTEQFVKIIDKLVHLWEGQMKDYEAEEKTLRVMLQESPEKGEEKGPKDDLKNDLSKVEKNNRAWEIVLFGSDSTDDEDMLNLAPFRSFFLQPCQNLNVFIETRRHWDQFISNSPSSSSIPIGWVMPKEASSKEWKEVTKYD